MPPFRSRHRLASLVGLCTGVAGGRLSVANVESLSSTFEGATPVNQHQLIHDAMDEHLTDDIHAIELMTPTPDNGE